MIHSDLLINKMTLTLIFFSIVITCYPVSSAVTTPDNNFTYTTYDVQLPVSIQYGAPEEKVISSMWYWMINRSLIESHMTYCDHKGFI